MCTRRHRTQTLRWEDHRDTSVLHALGWWVLPSVAGSRSYTVARVGLLTTPSTPADPHYAYYDRSWQLDQGAGLNVPGTEILAALTEYLAVTPAAQRGLADPARTASLIDALVERNIRGFFRAEQPLMGPRLDLWNTVQRVLKAHVRRIYGRTVAGDPTPPIGELVETVQATLSRQVPAEWRTADRIDKVLARLLTDVEPWPFDRLATSNAHGN